VEQYAVEKYLKQLREVKERGKVFQAFSRGTANAIYEEATVEVATLQLRKILEILAFGFVLVAGEKAIPAYISFVKYKNVKKFFFQLRKLNKTYYLQPILQKHNEQGDMQWIDQTADEYLTPEDFDILYEHCNKVLEPRQVGALPMSIEQCKAANQRWYGKIVHLLNSHLVHSKDNDIAYLFQMGADDHHPTCTLFNIVSENMPPKVGREPLIKNSTITLKDHLCRQLGYLRRSCELYDAGHFDEAVHMAVIILNSRKIITMLVQGWEYRGP